jgi:hypothetical protein
VINQRAPLWTNIAPFCLVASSAGNGDFSIDLSELSKNNKNLLKKNLAIISKRFLPSWLAYLISQWFYCFLIRDYGLIIISIR